MNHPFQKKTVLQKGFSISLPFIILGSLFACSIGAIIGAAVVLIWRAPADVNLAQTITENVQISMFTNPLSSPPEDGFFIVDGGTFIQIPHLQDDEQLDFSQLPNVKSIHLNIVLKGKDFPLGNLVMIGYRAGFGIDVTYKEQGALINIVYEDSPADKVGLQPGDLIVNVDGEKPNRSMEPYTAGHLDLFGLMRDDINVQVLRGTNWYEFKLPRSYIYPEISNIQLNLGTQYKQAFILKPESDFVVLELEKPLKPGVYRLEFNPAEARQGGILLEFSGASPATPLPTLPPLPSGRWVFVVK